MHHFPIPACSRLAYPVYLLKKIQQSKGDKTLVLLYDIACVLETHLKVMKFY